MRVLVLTPGSSTLKYRLIELSGPSTKAFASGLADHVEGVSALRAAEKVLAECKGHGIDAVGCRAAPGGERFDRPTRVPPDVVAAIRDLGRLAPLHNPTAAAVLDAVLG